MESLLRRGTFPVHDEPFQNVVTLEPHEPAMLHNRQLIDVNLRQPEQGICRIVLRRQYREPVGRGHDFLYGNMRPVRALHCADVLQTYQRYQSC